MVYLFYPFPVNNKYPIVHFWVKIIILFPLSLSNTENWCTTSKIGAAFVLRSPVEIRKVLGTDKHSEFITSRTQVLEVRINRFAIFHKLHVLAA